MRKTLHDYFYINTGEKIKPPYSSTDAVFLIEAANLHLDRKKDNNSLSTIPILDTFIYECMNEFYQNSVSDNLLIKLNEILWNISMRTGKYGLRGLINF